MLNEQHEMIVTKERFLIFRQLRVKDFEASEKFLLYGKSVRNRRSLLLRKVLKQVETCCKICR